jgi:dephospho-CoA kinase
MKQSKAPIYTIGLTGLTGGGKTTVLKLLAEQGGFPIVTDEVAHEVILRGQPAYTPIITAFGKGVLGDRDEIDRRRLGELVFGQAYNMYVLESIVHPHVITETKKRIKQAAADKYLFVIIDAPLLVEAGMHSLCDSVWLVTADEALRKRRITKRDGLTEETADKRLSSRQSEDNLKPYAHVVIVNDGDLVSLTQTVLKQFKGLKICEKK